MGGIAETLAHIGNRMREDHLLDLQDRIAKQNKSLDFLSQAYQNPQVAPEDQAGIFNLLLETSGTPAAKYDASKTAKKFADLMAQSHNRAVGQADENAQQTPANLKFQIPGGTYDAGGFESNPPFAAPQPPPGMPSLPTGGLPQPPTLRAGAPNLAAIPGAPTTMELPGLAAPDSSVPGAVQPFFDPMRAIAMQAKQLEALAPTQIAIKGAEAEAQQQAELRRQIGVSQFEHEETKKLLDEYKSQGVRHTVESIGSNGKLSIKPDLGRPMPGMTSGSFLQGELDQNGKPLDPGVYYRIREFADGGKEYFAQPSVKESKVMPDGNSPTGFSLVWYSRDGKEVDRTPGATPPSAFVPSVQTQITPGLPPTTTTTVRKLPGQTAVAAPGQGTSAAPPNPPAGAGLGRPTAFGARVQSDSYPAAIKQRAKAVADGSQPMPTDARTSGAVQQYMAEHNLQLPTPMTAAGQAAMAQVDPVLQEVQDLKKFLQDNKLEGNTQRAFFAPKFLNYRAGGDTPYNEFFTGASFESLRSAASALKGSNSRAMPILNKALVHTPNLWLDSPKNIYEKLDAVEKILNQSKASILADEKKSGVVGAPQNTPPPNPPAGSVVHWGRDAQGNPVPIQQ